MKVRSFAAIVLLFSFTISFAKDNSFFAGTRINNGKIINALRFKYDNGEKHTFKQKSYYLGSYIFFGGTIKNVSISSGIGYNLYHFTNKMDYDLIDPIIAPFKYCNNHLISIPLNIDYNINIYKDKLFVTIGAGIEYTVTVVQKFKFPASNGLETTFKYKDLNKTYNMHSAVITARCGLLYSVNSRIDVFSTFDFGIFATKYLPMRNNPYESVGNAYNYILSNSIGLNVKFGKNNKKEKKEKETSLKTTSYKTPPLFSLN
jgi:hypothetical protein